jgi:hypothetical protein
MALGALLVLLPLWRHADGGAPHEPGEVLRTSAPGERALLSPGERLQYGLSIGPIHAGRATLTVDDAEPMEGEQAYRVTLKVTGGALFLTIDDSLVSWIAPGPLHTVRSDRRLHEGPDTEALRIELHDRDGRYRILPLPGAPPSEAPQEEPTGSMPDDPLDELAVLFLPRSLPLESGAEYRVPRYFQERDNPVDIQVLGRDRIRTPAGEFPVVVLGAVIPGTGLFAPERHARVYVTDDTRRSVVELTANTAFGKLRLYLTDRSGG